MMADGEPSGDSECERQRPPNLAWERVSIESSGFEYLCAIQSTEAQGFGASACPVVFLRRGMRRPVRPVYLRYPSPNCSRINRSSRGVRMKYIAANAGNTAHPASQFESIMP